MPEKTDREDIETWLQESPVDWSQVIAARGALRVLPQALSHTASDSWFDVFAISLLRACMITWMLRNSIADDGRIDAGLSGARAAADAAFNARAAARAAAKTEERASIAADTIANATDAARADSYPEFAARAAWQAVEDASKFGGISESFDIDRRWLLEDANRAHLTNELASERLNKRPLWFADKTKNGGRYDIRKKLDVVPHWFDDAWIEAKERLTSRSDTFRVWIDWFENVLRGNELAFCRTIDAEDFVRRRLLNAEEAFWRQDPPAINETILHWITQAELEDELEKLIQNVRNRNGSLGSAAERGARENLSGLLKALADVELPSIGIIGHNQPPEPIEWQIEIVVSSGIKSHALEAVAELAKPIPDAVLVAEKVSVIGRGLKKLAALTGVAAEKAAGAFGTAIGAAAGLTLVSVIALLWTRLLDDVINWLKIVF